MEIDRHPESEHDLPQRIPMTLSEVRHLVVLGTGIGVDSLQSHFVAADGLLDRNLDVPPRHQRHRKDAVARFLLNLRHRIVEDLGAQHAQLGVEGGGALTAETQQVRIDDLRPDSFPVHELQTRLDVI